MPPAAHIVIAMIGSPNGGTHTYIHTECTSICGHMYLNFQWYPHVHVYFLIRYFTFSPLGLKVLIKFMRPPSWEYSIKHHTKYWKRKCINWSQLKYFWAAYLQFFVVFGKDFLFHWKYRFHKHFNFSVCKLHFPPLPVDHLTSFLLSQLAEKKKF